MGPHSSLFTIKRVEDVIHGHLDLLLHHSLIFAILHLIDD